MARAARRVRARRGVRLGIVERTREQTAAGDLHYLFAPLKHARLDYMVQKAVEMGASRLQPVMTRHTQAERVNLARMRANAIEAAEQCGILDIAGDRRAGEARCAGRARWKAERLLVFCDEDADVKDPVAALCAGARPAALRVRRRSACWSVPKAASPRRSAPRLSKLPNVIRLALGPRILRADTAAVAALALVQAVLGDWR